MHKYVSSFFPFFSLLSGRYVTVQKLPNPNATYLHFSELYVEDTCTTPDMTDLDGEFTDIFGCSLAP